MDFRRLRSSRLLARKVAALSRRLSELQRPSTYAGTSPDDGWQNGEVSKIADPAADWWTTSDVAAYLGVRIATVSTYRTRGQMPAPDMTVGRTHVWKPARIIEWHEKRPRPGVGGRPVSPADPSDVEGAR